MRNSAGLAKSAKLRYTFDDSGWLLESRDVFDQLGERHCNCPFGICFDGVKVVSRLGVNGFQHVVIFFVNVPALRCTGGLLE